MTKLRTQLPTKSEIIRPILESFKEELIKIYPEKLLVLILFGSYARGDFRADSDVDLLIILPTFRSAFEEIERLSEIKYDFLIRYGVLISTITVKTQEFEENKKLFFKNIRKEGIVL